ncbi:MAG TPA: SOS response-associated peptidase family protein [Pyrinomonadaceae bacterium]|nr:SOS response-associated peptidase family protein [Pyrinomonadaceae bacterium]
MCGRYLLKALSAEIIQHFELVDGLEYFDEHGYKFDREVFPGEPILAINKHHLPEDLWWTIRDRTFDGKITNAINARSETVAKVPMFRDAFKNDRVLIPASAIYEWQQRANGEKARYEISFDTPLFALAGIARDCEIKGETRRSTAILTTTPNEVFREIHNIKQRQAVVIREADYERWLDPRTSLEDLKPLMQPLPSEVTHTKEAAEPPTKPAATSSKKDKVGDGEEDSSDREVDHPEQPSLLF